MIKVTSQLTTYDDTARQSVKVHSHWSDKRKVVLEVEGQSVTVIGQDLKAAIDNAMNRGAP